MPENEIKGNSNATAAKIVGPLYFAVDNIDREEDGGVTISFKGDPFGIVPKADVDLTLISLSKKQVTKLSDIFKLSSSDGSVFRGCRGPG